MMKTDQFHYRPVPGIMFTEASNLPENQAEIGMAEITVQSTHTGRTMVFDRLETVRDVGGDILHWVYIPSPYQQNVPHNVAKLYIFND